MELRTYWGQHPSLGFCLASFLKCFRASGWGFVCTAHWFSWNHVSQPHPQGFVDRAFLMLGSLFDLLLTSGGGSVQTPSFFSRPFVLNLALLYSVCWTRVAPCPDRTKKIRDVSALSGARWRSLSSIALGCMCFRMLYIHRAVAVSQWFESRAEQVAGK